MESDIPKFKLCQSLAMCDIGQVTDIKLSIFTYILTPLVVPPGNGIIIVNPQAAMGGVRAPRSRFC